MRNTKNLTNAKVLQRVISDPSFPQRSGSRGRKFCVVFTQEAIYASEAKTLWNDSTRFSTFLLQYLRKRYNCSNNQVQDASLYYS